MSLLGFYWMWLLWQTLARWPSLSVRLDRDPALAGQSVEIEILREADAAVWGADPKPVRVCQTSGGSGRFEHLPPDAYRVLAKLGSLRQSADVDLSDGKSREISLSFERRKLTGTVTRRGDPVPARIELRPSPTAIHRDPALSATAEADELGCYSARLFPGMLYTARVHSLDPSRPGWRTARFLMPEKDSERDFDLRQIEVRVHVADATSELPISGARVLVPGAGEANGLRTDAEGVANFTSLEAGAHEATALAKGYDTARETLRVADSDAPQDFSIALEPSGAGRKFSVVMPDGSPATSVVARWGAVGDGMGLPIPCNGEGICTAPDSAPDGAPVLFLAQGAGATVEPLGEILASGTAVLSPPAGPLRVDIRPEAIPKDAVGVAATIVISGVPFGELELELIDGAGGGNGFADVVAFHMPPTAPLLLHGLPSDAVQVQLVSIAPGKTGGIVTVPLGASATVMLGPGGAELTLP